MSVIIRVSPDIRANLIVLANVGVPTKLLRMKKMTPTTRKFLDNFDIVIGVAKVTARRSACVGFCFSMHFLVFNRSKRFGCLLDVEMNIL